MQLNDPEVLWQEGSVRQLQQPDEIVGGDFKIPGERLRHFVLLPGEPLGVVIDLLVHAKRREGSRDGDVDRAGVVEQGFVDPPLG